MEVRIKQAIFGLSEKLPSQVRAFTDAYYPHISPSMVKWGDTRFPTGVRRQPRDPERTTASGKDNVLYFHIGNTILAYYDFLTYAARNDKGELVDRPGAAYLPTLERRIKLLEDIGKRGYSSFVATGNGAEGYALCHRDEVPVRFKPSSEE